MESHLQLSLICKILRFFKQVVPWTVELLWGEDWKASWAKFCKSFLSHWRRGEFVEELWQGV